MFVWRFRHLCRSARGKEGRVRCGLTLLRNLNELVVIHDFRSPEPTEVEKVGVVRYAVVGFRLSDNVHAGTAIFLSQLTEKAI